MASVPILPLQKLHPDPKSRFCHRKSFAPRCSNVSFVTSNWGLYWTSRTIFKPNTRSTQQVAPKGTPVDFAKVNFLSKICSRITWLVNIWRIGTHWSRICNLKNSSTWARFPCNLDENQIKILNCWKWLRSLKSLLTRKIFSPVYSRDPVQFAIQYMWCILRTITLIMPYFHDSYLPFNVSCFRTNNVFYLEQTICSS